MSSAASRMSAATANSAPPPSAWPFSTAIVGVGKLAIRSQIERIRKAIEDASSSVRNIPAELTKRYVDEGWWTQDTLGDLIARGLQARPDAGFRVHSDVRPFAGTFHDVEIEARRLAAGLRARGVGAGDVVALQLPN